MRKNINYVLILNTNAGLFGYNLGDTIKFVSLNPYKIVVTGRIKHFTSAFGEHVISEEVEKSLNKALDYSDCEVNEIHVSPVVNPKNGLPFHEWLIEFGKKPDNINDFQKLLDNNLQDLNLIQRPYSLKLQLQILCSLKWDLNLDIPKKV